MPRAGWCRECGEWVWVDEQDSCQNGHGPECVAGIHEAQAQAETGEPDERSTAIPSTDDTAEEVPDHVVAPADSWFGVGELPDGVYRFNWGAFFLAPVWGVVYGSWTVVNYWVLTIMVSLLAGSLVGIAGAADTAMGLATATVVSEVAGGAIRLWVGMNANRWLWRRDALRLEYVEGARPRFSVMQFTARQRVWGWVGFALRAFSALSLVILAVAPEALFSQFATQFTVSRLDLWIALVWVLAEIGLAWWLSVQMRKERPGAGVKVEA